MEERKIPSLQSVLKRRRQTLFVGRDKQIELYSQNLISTLNIEDERYRFVFGISGPAGVGKTSLLHRYAQLAEAAHSITAFTDENQKDVLEVMAHIAHALVARGNQMKPFLDKYQHYNDLCHKLGTDKDAPGGSSIAGQILAKIGVGLVRRIPVAGELADFADEKAIAEQAATWISFAVRKLEKAEDAALVQNPVHQLTHLFLQELGKLSLKYHIALFFDTYEVTSLYLDAWLRDLLEGNYGEFPGNIVFTIGGQEELDRNLWSPYEGIIARLPLEPFTRDEALEYLGRHGISDTEAVEEILELSGGLPVLLATLADENLKPSFQREFVSNTAVERFLKWVQDPAQREVALNAALPRLLNQDVVQQILIDSDTPDASGLFDWLKHRPFVKEQRDGWAYHPVVRAQMLRYKYIASAQLWGELHRKLARYYEARYPTIELAERERWHHPGWRAARLTACYHNLCIFDVQEVALGAALANFVAAVAIKRSYAKEWIEVIEHAGKDLKLIGRDAGGTRLLTWATRLSQCLEWYEDGKFADIIGLASQILSNIHLDAHGRALVYGWRGTLYVRTQEYEKALQDLSITLDSMPDQANYLLERAQTFYALDRYEEALADLSSVLEEEGDKPFAKAMIGLIFWQQDRLDEALQVLTDVITSGADISARLSFTLYKLRGNVLQGLERLDEALADYQFMKDLAADTKQEIEAYDCLGQVHAERKELDLALDWFNRGLELDKNATNLLCNRGIAYRLMERYDEALADFNRVLEKEPDDVSFLIRRAGTFELMNQYEEALADYERALEREPHDILILFARGSLFQRMRRFEDALTDLSHAIELNPATSREVAHCLCHRGQILSELERFDEALRDLNDAIERDPKRVETLVSRARCYREVEQFERALADINHALALTSNDLESESQLLQERGFIYLEYDKVGRALADLDRSVSMSPSNALPYRNRARAYARLSQFEKALADVSHAIELEPHDPIAWRLRADSTAN